MLMYSPKINTRGVLSYHNFLADDTTYIYIIDYYDSTLADMLYAITLLIVMYRTGWCGAPRKKQEESIAS